MTPLEAQRAAAQAATVALRRRHDGHRHALALIAAIGGQG